MIYVDNIVGTDDDPNVIIAIRFFIQKISDEGPRESNLRTTS